MDRAIAAANRGTVDTLASVCANRRAYARSLPRQSVSSVTRSSVFSRLSRKSTKNPSTASAVIANGRSTAMWPGSGSSQMPSTSIST